MDNPCAFRTVLRAEMIKSGHLPGEQRKQTTTHHGSKPQKGPFPYPPTYRSRRRRVGLRGVLSSPEEEALLSWLDQTGEHNSVQPRSLSLTAAGAESGQAGIVRGSRAGVAGGGPAGT